MSELLFVGTGEAADPELPNTSLLYRGGRTLLLDCGYGVPHALWRHTRDPELIDAIVLSHRHGDHTLGLPGLLLWMAELGRRRPLVLLGPSGVGVWLPELLEMSYPGFTAKESGFECDMRALAPGEVAGLGPLRLEVAASDHPVENLAVRIEEGGRAACYSGDGKMTGETAALFRGAGVLVHECYAAQPLSSAHADAGSLLPAIERLDVASAFLVHIGRAHKEEVRRAAREWRGRTRVLVPAPGDVVSL